MSSESETYKLIIQTPGNFDAAVAALTNGGDDRYGDYAALFNTGSVTTTLLEDIPREKWATVLERTGYTGTLACTLEYTRPWKISFDGAAWHWRIEGARAYGPGGDTVVGHRDGALTVRAKGPVPFWVIKAVLRCDDDCWYVGYRRDEDPPEEELAQAITAARADDCWDEDTEDAWTADDALALDLEDQLEQALASADADEDCDDGPSEDPSREFFDDSNDDLLVEDADSGA